MKRREIGWAIEIALMVYLIYTTIKISLSPRPFHAALMYGVHWVFAWVEFITGTIIGLLVVGFVAYRHRYKKFPSIAEAMKTAIEVLRW